MKKKLSKIEFHIMITVFILTLCVSNLFKKSINYVDAPTLAKAIQGVGEIKSTRIVAERDKNGHYKNEKDFYHRTKDLGIGEVVYNRIKKEYRF